MKSEKIELRHSCSNFFLTSLTLGSILLYDFTQKINANKDLKHYLNIDIGNFSLLCQKLEKYALLISFGQFGEILNVDFTLQPFLCIKFHIREHSFTVMYAKI